MIFAAGAVGMYERRSGCVSRSDGGRCSAGAGADVSVSISASASASPSAGVPALCVAACDGGAFGVLRPDDPRGDGLTATDLDTLPRCTVVVAAAAAADPAPNPEPSASAASSSST